MANQGHLENACRMEQNFGCTKCSFLSHYHSGVRQEAHGEQQERLTAVSSFHFPRPLVASFQVSNQSHYVVCGSSLQLKE